MGPSVRGMRGWKDQSCLSGTRIPAVSHEAPYNTSWVNVGSAPGSSTRTPERLEQTADHCRALAGLVTSVSAMNAGVRRRLGAFSVRGPKVCMTMLVTFSEAGQRAQLRPKQKAHP